MPNYDYECKMCGQFEVSHKMFESIRKCPYCKGKVNRIIGKSAIMFKGNGFYINDYGRSKEYNDKLKDEKHA